MPAYRAPLRDMRFVFDEVLDASNVLQGLPDQGEFSSDLADAILEEAAKLAENVMHPLNRVGDAEGCTTTPPSFNRTSTGTPSCRMMTPPSSIRRLVPS